MSSITIPGPKEPSPKDVGGPSNETDPARVVRMSINSGTNIRLFLETAVLSYRFLVGLSGLEPEPTEPKSVVLPLHHNPIPPDSPRPGTGLRAPCPVAGQQATQRFLMGTPSSSEGWGSGPVPGDLSRRDPVGSFTSCSGRGDGEMDPKVRYVSRGPCRT